MAQSILKAVAEERKPPAEAQMVCIDLPGEAIRCGRSTEKVKVVLRKHRDVIFEIELFKGMQYSVEAQKSDFYNARDKKLVEAKRKQKVVFADGERLHLWVSREFQGALILKANGKFMTRYVPNEIDMCGYDYDPATKPAPLIVVMKNEPAPPVAQKLASVTAQEKPSALQTPQWSPWSEEQMQKSMQADAARRQQHQDEVQRPEEVMYVVEVKQGYPNLPSEISDFFKRGGEETAIDSNKVLTRNWLWAQIVGTAVYYDQNKSWIKELWKTKFYLQKVVHKNAGAMYYIVFKGYPGLRQYLTSARYGVTAEKVIAITSGAGSAKGLRHAGWANLKGSLGTKGGVLALVFTITLDTAEWLNDYQQVDPATGKPKKDFFDLCLKIGVDIAKVIISTAVGTVLMATLAAVASLVFGLSIVGGVFVVGAIGISILVGIGIDWLDKKTGFTDELNLKIRNSARYLGEKFGSDYGTYEGSIEQALQFGMGS